MYIMTIRDISRILQVSDIWVSFHVLLTVHLSIFILVINQLDAQIFFVLQ